MFRFTIRELLILTVTAGLAVGWWLDHRRHAATLGKLEYDNYMLRMNISMREDILNSLDKNWKDYLRTF